MNFPVKPWTDGQTAELVAGTTFVYNAAKGAWVVHLTATEAAIIANADSDFAHFTGAISVVDGSIQVVASDVTALGARVDSDFTHFTTKLAAAVADIATNTADIAQLQSDVAAIGSGSLSTIEARLDSDYALNNTKHAVQEAAIGANTTAITGLQSDVSTLQTESADYETRLQVLETDVPTAVQDIGRLYQEADSDAGTIASVAAAASLNQAAIVDILADLDSDGVNIQALRTDLEAEIAATNADVTAINGRLDSDSAKLQSLQTQVNAIGSGSLSAVEARLDADSDRATAIEASVTLVQSDVTTNTSDIATLQSDVSTVQGNITGLQSDVSTLQTDVVTAQNTADQNALDIASNATAITDSGKIHKQNTAPSSPSANDMWFDTDTSTMYSWDSTNSVWVQVI